MKNFLKSNTFYIIISLTIAILLWIYVVYEVRPTYEMWIEDVPVNCINKSALFDEGSIAIVGDYEDLFGKGITVDVKVRGKRSIISSVKRKDISCMLDLLTVNREGDYPIKPDIDTSNPAIQIVQCNPSTIKLHIESIKQSTFDVETVVKGEVPKGYVLEDLKNQNSTVKVTGPSTIIGKISTARVVLDCSSLSVDDSEKNLLIEFADSKGDKLDSSLFTKSIEHCKVSFKLYTTKEVTVKLVPKYKDDTNTNASGQTVALYVLDSDGEATEGKEIKVTLTGTASAMKKYTDTVRTVYTEPIDVSNIYYQRDFSDVPAASLSGDVSYDEIPKVTIRANVE